MRTLMTNEIGVYVVKYLLSVVIIILFYLEFY